MAVVLGPHLIFSASLSDRERHGKGRLLPPRVAVRDAMDLTPSLWFSSLVKVSCSDLLTIGWCTSTRSHPSSSPWSVKDRKQRQDSIDTADDKWFIKVRGGRLFFLRAITAMIEDLGDVAELSSFFF